MATISGRTIAWITRAENVDYSSINCESINEFAYYDRDMTDSGWAKIGEATITIDLVDIDNLVANQIDALEAEIKAVEGRAYARVTELQGKIQNLKAITYQESNGDQNSVE
jgi:gamma-glutamylcyclotransferase (GGCT)/AIG2-like uncharacterized protein YtfP